MTYPWEQVPATVEPTPATRSVEDTVTALQRDFAYAVGMTAVRVHSSREELRATVNTPRGQIIPHGEVRFSDGTTLEFYDMGMPQPKTPTMATVKELVAHVWTLASELGLTLP